MESVGRQGQSVLCGDNDHAIRDLEGVVHGRLEFYQSPAKELWLVQRVLFANRPLARYWKYKYTIAMNE